MVHFKNVQYVYNAPILHFGGLGLILGGTLLTGEIFDNTWTYLLVFPFGLGWSYLGYRLKWWKEIEVE
jgi:hypothetical protein